MTEQWKKIAEFPDYEVSDLGNVRSRNGWIEQVSRNGRLYRRRRAGRVLRPGLTRGGYRIVGLGKDAQSKRVSRLVAKAFCQGSGAVVRHKNGVVTDDRAANLAWGSQSDNIRDAVAHGTWLSARRLAHLRSIARKGGLACRRA